MTAHRAILTAVSILGLSDVAGGAAAADRCRAQSDREIVASVPFASAQPDALAAALSAIGYRNVELGDGVDSAPAGLADSLRRSRLTLTGARQTLAIKGWERIVALAKGMGLSYLAADSVGAPGVRSLEDTLQTAANLNVLGEMARAQRITLIARLGRDELSAVYPFDIKGDGNLVPTRAADILMRRTDPDNVSFDVDVAGAIAALGANAAQGVPDFLAGNRRRIVMLNMRDALPSGAPAVLGHGGIDWPGVFAAAGGGIRYYLASDPQFSPTPSGVLQAQADFAYLRCKG